MSFTFVPLPVYEPYRPDTYQTIRENMITLLSAVLDGLVALTNLERVNEMFDNITLSKGGPRISPLLPYNWSSINAMSVETNAVHFMSYLSHLDRGYEERIGYIISELKRTSINSPRLCGVSTYVLHSLTSITVSNLNVTNSYRIDQWEDSKIEFSDSTDHWMEAVMKYSDAEMFMMVVSDIISKIDLSKVDLVSLKLHHQALQNREYLQDQVNKIYKIIADINVSAEKLTVLANAIDSEDWSLVNDVDTLNEFLGPETSIKYSTAWVAWAS